MDNTELAIVASSEMVQGKEERVPVPRMPCSQFLLYLY